MDIQKAHLIHNNKYDYSLVDYVNNYTKVKIICPVHGIYTQTPNSHLCGHGCPLCNKYRSNKEHFINKAKKAHGNKYDYSRVNYRGNKTKIIIICPVHGEFEQQPNHHVSGSGCPKCSMDKRLLENRKKKSVEFVSKAALLHNGKYDYSKVTYVKGHDKVTIICPKHGEFEQSPSAHLRGQGCPSCGRINTINSHSYDLQEFIKKAHKIHGFKYNYSKVNYCSCLMPVTIVCPQHGEYKQTPQSHLRGSGCVKCAGYWDEQIFIKKAKAIHGNRYCYSNVKYINANKKVKILCKKHGFFWQTPYNHIDRCGCPKCALSTIQYQLYDYVSKLTKTELNNRSIIKPYELDLYLPEYKMAIEIDGLYWHSFDKKATRQEKYRHYMKHEACESHGINLLQIWESEWLNKKSIVLSMIKSRLQITNKIAARKCQFVKISYNQFKEFLDKHHLQGCVPTRYRYALLHDGEIIQVLGFNTHKLYNYEISRFATKEGITVVGGFSKLFKNALLELNTASVMTFANRRYSIGSVYRKCGFLVDSITPPNYFYIKSKHCYSRVRFQKHKLSSILPNFDPCLTETENMFNNGYRQLWDAGNYKLIWTSPISML